MPDRKPDVALFVTCLADVMRPNVAFAAARLIEAAGAVVHVPDAQTCCGQPGYNAGADAAARAIAERVIETFLPYDYVVAPSGSCAGMIKTHYAALFAGEPDWLLKQEELAAKTYELTQFLHGVMNWRPEGVSLKATATYHDSCSGLRELGVKAEPRALLAGIDGLELRSLAGAEACCGFGGAFCVKYPDISGAIVADKARAIRATGAEILLAGDLGCLMNMAGKLSRDGAPVRCFHVAEALAGMIEGDGI
ncbi:MAG: (Fe-S)-binding protein [Alphaproteobacteria bacterium]